MVEESKKGKLIIKTVVENRKPKRKRKRKMEKEYQKGKWIMKMDKANKQGINMDRGNENRNGIVK